MSFCDLSGKKALVTGGSRGIGYAIAHQLKEQGADITIVGTQEETTAKAAQELGVQHHVADISDAEAVEGLLEAVGPLDVLVNNAGITRDGLFLRQKNEDWASVLEVNLTSAARLTRLALPAMLKNRWGRVVNISSVVGHTGNVGQTNYVAAKAGLTGFTKALAVEVARKGITVNCVAPGFIETNMTAEMSSEKRAAMAAQIPAARLGQPEDVATAVGFLASESAGYITGTTLHVNGGMFSG